MSQLIEASEAIKRIPVGAAIVASSACAGPTTLLGALGDAASPDRGWQLSSGLLFEYPFLDAVAARVLQYRTWHVMAPVRALVAQDIVEYVPLRASLVPAMIEARRFDVAMVRVSPPDHDGNCSFGPSASYARSAIEASALCIAEVDETMPRTCGESLVHISEIDVFVRSATPMPSYRVGRIDEVSQRIAESIIELLSPRPTLQIGIGHVPEAVVVSLGEAAGLGPLRFVGMATDAMVDLYHRGVIDQGASCPTPAILTSEMLGTEKLMRFGDNNPAIGVYPSSIAHDAAHLGDLERFTAIVSAIEVDLSGQVNSETLAGRPIGAVGGSVDYFEAAMRSPGGSRIIALPSTSSDGSTSRIVPHLGTRTAVTVPRTMVDVVVTEHGVARLAGRSLRERAEALTAIAHPDYRDVLADTSMW
jgi:4-hydroxybutyrate CoA-transferase